MRQLGTIVGLQIQQSGLKVPAPEGSLHPRHYDPAPLRSVDALLLTPDGVLEAETRKLDVHHRSHPDTRNVDVNGVSIGFTAHYGAMRQRFGDRLWDGVAGENVLVEAQRQVSVEELSGGVVIRTADGTLARLEAVIVAEPCVEFTRFALGMRDSDRTNQQVTEGLKFLREGMRGFYATFAGETVLVRRGDAVFAVD